MTSKTTNKFSPEVRARAVRMAPWAKPGTGRYLSFSEREDIAMERAKGLGIRAIACKLGRSPSTVSREIRRNAATRSGRLDYRPSTAQWHADRAARRPRGCKLASKRSSANMLRSVWLVRSEERRVGKEGVST